MVPFTKRLGKFQAVLANTALSIHGYSPDIAGILTGIKFTSKHLVPFSCLGWRYACGESRSQNNTYKVLVIMSLIYFA